MEIQTQKTSCLDLKAAVNFRLVSIVRVKIKQIEQKFQRIQARFIKTIWIYEMYGPVETQAIPRESLLH